MKFKIFPILLLLLLPFILNANNVTEEMKSSINNYFKIYPVDKIYKEKTDYILKQNKINPDISEKERRTQLKPYTNQIIVNKNEFSKLVSQNNISKTKYLLVVGENISKRDAFYDKIFAYGVTIINTLITFGAILVPIFMIIILLPPAIYGIYKLSKEKEEKLKFQDIAVYIVLIIAFYFTLRMGYFYSINIYNSVGAFFNELFEALVILILSIFMIPFFLIYLIFVLSSDSKGFEFYPDGTMINIAVELTRIHLSNIGVTVELDKDILIVGLKLILLVLMLKNIKLAINAIFITYSEWIKWFFYFICIGTLFGSIYWFNQELILLLAKFITEIYTAYKGF